MPSETTHEQKEHKVKPGTKRAYHGRVRSGCITCRRRKVKCDEARPLCDNCIRLKRRCVYTPPKVPLSDRALHSSSGPSSVHSAESCDAGPKIRDSLYVKTHDAVLADTLGLKAIPVCLGVADGEQDSCLLHLTTRLHTTLRQQTEACDGDAGSDEYDPAALISEDIKLTTTMDLLRAREVPLQSSFLYFVDSVDCPAITPYDAQNWKRAKYYLAELGTSNTVVGSAIIALSSLDKALRHALPLSRALSFYQSSRADFDKHTFDGVQKFDAMLAAAFLLCLFDFLHQETIPLLSNPSEALLNAFEAGHEDNMHQSEQSARILSWLRLIHANALRAGGNGLISDSIRILSPYYNNGRAMTQMPSDMSFHGAEYDMLQRPIFDFYFQLQMISGQIAKLTHYHRSRITGPDQEEVIEHLLHIRSRLVALWERRSAAQRQTPHELRSTLPADIAEPLITLVGLCSAAYHVEFVEMDRVIGDPITKSAGSRTAMHEIRNIVDGDWNCYDSQNNLNPGYLRPLFLYAIECMDHDQNRWAVERMRSINDWICRSNFFAEFGRRLLCAQLQKERRVTSKYFCIWVFGTPPPFM